MRTFVELDLSCLIIQNTKENFLVLIDDIPYDLTIKFLGKKISLIIQSGNSWHKYNTSLYFEDFEKINSKFSQFEKLKDIHELMLKKIYQEEILIIEEGLLLSLKFDLDLFDKKEEIELNIPINSDWGNGPTKKDLCRTIIKLSNKIKKLQNLGDVDQKHKEKEKKNLIYDINSDESFTISSKISSSFSSCDNNNLIIHNDKNIQTEFFDIKNNNVILLEKSINTISEQEAKDEDNQKLKENDNFILIEKNPNEKNNQSMIVDTAILNEKDKRFLMSCFDCKFELELIYRGTKDGEKSTDFHKFCDNKGPTLSLILTDNGYKFGGFTNLEWESKLGYKKNDPEAFLFSLNKQKKYICNSEYVIYCNPDASIVFGNGHDIYISDNWDERTYSDFPFSFGNRSNVWLNEMVPRKYMPIEVEVFSLKKL